MRVCYLAKLPTSLDARQSSPESLDSEQGTQDWRVLTGPMHTMFEGPQLPTASSILDPSTGLSEDGEGTRQDDDLPYHVVLTKCLSQGRTCQVALDQQLMPTRAVHHSHLATPHTSRG